MAGHKHLRDFLSQDQEPFLLHDFILHRRRQLRPIDSPVSLLSKPKSTRDLRLPSHYGFCLKSLRFVSSHDVTKSPLFEFPSAAAAPPISPSRKGAVSLLEAASRIQRSCSARLRRERGLGSGVLGAILKRLVRRKSKSTHASHVEYPSVCCDHADVVGNGVVCDENSGKGVLPFERASPEGQSPEYSSPAATPEHSSEGNEARFIQDGPNRDTCRATSKGREDEEERDQFSPVSVLDPPFEVDDEDADSPVGDCEEEGDRGDVGSSFDYDCSFAFVQRTKQQLLDKLQRFERLARLDPVELEKRMLESDDDGDDDGRVTICVADLRKSPNDVSRMVRDLMAEEEEGESKGSDRGNARPLIERVNERMESWEAGLCTADDAMTGGEMSARWKPEEEQLGLLAEEIEVGMLESLLEELTELS